MQADQALIQSVIACGDLNFVDHLHGASKFTLLYVIATNLVVSDPWSVLNA